MDNMYYLNLAALLKTLAAVSAILTAELPDGIPGHTEPCKGFIRVHDNSIIMCAVLKRGKVIAEGLQALQFLQNHKAWHVSFPPDLLSDTGSHQAPSFPSQPSQRANITSSRLPAQENQRYFRTLVQASPTTGSFPQPPALLVNARDPQMTDPLSQKELVSAPEQPSSYTSTQQKVPVTRPVIIADGKVFQQQMTLTSEMIGKYNPRERLILRTVYSKINGQRRVDQLKDDLRLPAVIVERSLAELCQLGIIA